MMNSFDRCIGTGVFLAMGRIGIGLFASVAIAEQPGDPPCVPIP